MTQYTIVSTEWPAGTFPNTALLNETYAKAAEMIAAGKLVKGSLGTSKDPYSPRNVEVVGYHDTNKPWKSNLIEIIDPTDPTKKTFEWVDGQPQRMLRVFTSVGAAEEWNTFVSTLGATGSYILDEETFTAIGYILPDDEIIAQYVVAQ